MKQVDDHLSRALAKLSDETFERFLNVIKNCEGKSPSQIAVELCGVMVQSQADDACRRLLEDAK